MTTTRHHRSSLLSVSIIVLTVCSVIAHAQAELRLFGTDNSAFPQMKTNFLLMDAAASYVRSSSTTDFQLRENGIARTITNIVCPGVDSIAALSSVLVIDISGSMSGGMPSNMTLAKVAAHEWIKVIPPKLSECAIVSFNSTGYLNLDFTDDKAALNAAVDRLEPNGGTNYDGGLLTPPSGALSLLGTQHKKPVILFLTDGVGTCNKDEILKQARLLGATIYCICVNLKAPLQLHEIAEQTNGLVFEEVKGEKGIVEVYRFIYTMATGNKFCTMEWMSGFECDTLRTFDAVYTPFGVSGSSTWSIDQRRLPGLNFQSRSVRFKNVTPGVAVTQSMTVIATADSTRIDSIQCTSPYFTIVNASLPVILLRGQSYTFSVRYNPLDSTLRATSIRLSGNFCSNAMGFASGGYPINRDVAARIHVDTPNGGERFVGGDTCVIRWSGVLPDDTVRIEYSSDRGVHWNLVTNSATDLAYLWRVPRISSRLCRIRVSQIAQLNNADSVLMLKGHTAAVQDIAFSPEAAQVATVSSDFTLRLWETQSGFQTDPETNLNKLLGTLYGVAWSSDPRVLAVCGNLGAGLFSRATRDTLRFMKTASVVGTSIVGQNCYSCDFNPDGKFLFVSTNLARVLAWAVDPSPDPNKNILAIPTAHSAATRCVRSSAAYFSKDVGNMLAFASAADDRTMSLSEITFTDVGGDYTMLTNNAKSMWYVGSDIMWSAVPSPDGSLIAGGTLSGQLVIASQSNATTFTPLANDAINEVAWSPNGDLIAIGYNSGRIALWDVALSTVVRVLDTNHASILGMRWDNFGSRIGAAYLNATALIWRVKDAPLQADASDADFSIINPVVRPLREIDFRAQSLGTQRDSVVMSLLCIDFPLPVRGWRLDSAWISANVDSSFTLVSGSSATFPATLTSCVSIEVGFRPRSVGASQGALMLAIGDTVYAISLRGEGVRSTYTMGPRMIDFGVVYIGGGRDTVVLPLMVNTTSNESCKVEATLTGPDTQQFSMQSDSVISVSSGDSGQIMLRLFGIKPGRTSCRMKLAITPGQSASSITTYEDVVLFGKVICGADTSSPPVIVACVPVDTAVAMEEILRIPLCITSTPGQTISSISTSFRVFLSFRSSDCWLTNAATITTHDSGRTQLVLEGERSLDTLLYLNILPLLSDTDRVEIRIDSVVFDNACSFRVRTENARFAISNICTAGGAKRLLAETGRTSIMCAPVPLSERVNLDVNLAESGNTRILVRDVVGRVVDVIHDTYLPAGHHTFMYECSQLNTGLYELHLQTVSQHRSLLVVKP